MHASPAGLQGLEDRVEDPERAQQTPLAQPNVEARLISVSMDGAVVIDVALFQRHPRRLDQGVRIDEPIRDDDRTLRDLLCLDPGRRLLADPGARSGGDREC